MQSSAGELAVRYRGDLLRFCKLKLGSAEQAREIMQESFVRFLAVDDVSKIDNPRSYLFRIANNLIVDHYRRSQAHSAVELPEPEPQERPDPGATPEQDCHCDELRTRFGAAFAGLSDMQQRIFYLRRFEGLPASDIAEQFNITPRMVQKHLAKIMRYFHIQLDEL